MNEFQSKIRKILGFLSRKDKRILISITCFQISLGILDLLGIAAMGVLGALTISGVSGTTPGDRVSGALQLLRIQELSLQAQATWLGILAAGILILKTLLSAFITRTSLRYLGLKGSEISGLLIRKLLESDLSTINRRSKQEILYSTTVGPSAMTLGVLGSVSLLISDISLSVLIFTGLFIVDWSLSISTMLLFGLVAAIVHRFLSKEARTLGSRIATLTVNSNQEIFNALENFREIATRGRRDYFSNAIHKTRESMAETSSDLTFLPNVSKYIVELTIVFGGLMVGSLQFLRQDAVHAVATLTLFVAASARIAPAVLRIQQGLVAVRVNLTACEGTLHLAEELSKVSGTSNRSLTYSADFPSLTVEIQEVDFSYTDFKIENLNLVIPENSLIALVGPSGSGKTTIADLLMGVTRPDGGKVLFNKIDSRSVIDQYPGIIAYVPQQVQVLKASVRENILFGFNSSEFPDDEIWKAIEAASLKETIENLPAGLDTQIGDGSNILSGGQRQRLGIARALLTKPRLIVFDEATSSLDAETEKTISDSISDLRSESSIVIIAHRLATIRDADLVVYIDDGKIQAKGSFEEVRAQIPDFDNQAKLLGL